MSGRIRYTEEFKRAAVAQVTERDYSVKDVASRLGVSTKSIYDWSKLYARPDRDRHTIDEHLTENRRLKAELARVTEERDILRKAAAYFASESR